MADELHTPQRQRAALPSYRPMRNTLASMGPSLAEERRRSRAVRGGVILLLGGVAVVVAVIGVILLLEREVVSAPPVPRSQDVATVLSGRPQPRTVARVVENSTTGDQQAVLELQLPINLHAVTGIGYAARRDGATFELAPDGQRANGSFGWKLLHRFLATEQPSSLRWYQLSNDDKLRVAVIGALPGAEVYAPISGTIVSVAPDVVADEQRGVIVQLQPLGDAETVVVLRGLDALDGVAVGQSVTEGTTPLGTVRSATGDGAPPGPLARYTHDDGSNVQLYVRRVQTSLAS